MRRLPWRLLAGTCLLIALGGCATAPKPLPGISPEQHQALQALQHWQIQGKLAIATPRQRESALLDWRQQHKHFDITLSGPLGAGKIRLQGDDQRLSYQRAGEAEQHSDDPSALLEQQLGWSLPIDMLRYWARGLPSPHLPVIQSASKQGVLTHLQQDGWVLEFSQHQVVDGVVLPGKLSATRDDIRITLIAKEWRL